MNSRIQFTIKYDPYSTRSSLIKFSTYFSCFNSGEFVENSDPSLQKKIDSMIRLVEPLLHEEQTLRDTALMYEWFFFHRYLMIDSNKALAIYKYVIY